MLHHCFPCCSDNTESPIVKPLSEAREHIHHVASIYFQEWGWHYQQDWEMPTMESISQDLEKYHLHSTYILLSKDKTLIGTVAIMDGSFMRSVHTMTNQHTFSRFIKRK